MESLELFDANVCVGRGMRLLLSGGATKESLLEAMDANGVGQALVWHEAQLGEYPAKGNELVARLVSGDRRLKGIWTALPPLTDESGGKDFFKRMKKSGAVALRAFPNHGRYLMRRRVWGSFMDEVSERRIPLILSPTLHISWDAIYDFMEEYPKIVCILADIGIWGVDRYTWPLLEAFPNLYLESGMLSLEAGGLEAACGKFGASRIVFGSGYPERYMEAAALQLSHAKIPASDKRRVAKGNLGSILKEVKL